MSSNVYTVKATKDIGEVAEGAVVLPISRTDGQKGKSGMAIVVPDISNGTLDLLFNNPISREYFHDVVTSIRSQIASNRNKNKLPILQEKLGYDSIVAAMKQANESCRITSKVIAEWFDTTLQGIIVKRLVEKNPSISADKAGKMADTYRQSFCILAGRDPSMKPEQKASLTRALALLPDDAEVSSLTIRIMKMLEQCPESSTAFDAL